jgi:hypothetical protein
MSRAGGTLDGRAPDAPRGFDETARLRRAEARQRIVAGIVAILLGRDEVEPLRRIADEVEPLRRISDEVELLRRIADEVTAALGDQCAFSLEDLQGVRGRLLSGAPPA